MTGYIDIRELNTPPEKHELATAKFFANRGKNIRFIKPSNRRGEHTPDFWMDGIAWEVKSPKSKTLNNIEDNLKDALKQSQYIIIDFQRLKMDEQRCLDKLRREINKRHNIKKLMVVTKQRRQLLILK